MTVVADISRRADHLHRLVLTQQPGRVLGVSEAAQRCAVEPRAVQVCADEHDGNVAAHRIEHLAVGRDRPQRRSKSEPEHGRARRRWAIGDELTDDSHRCGLRFGAGEIEARSRQRPLLEMHVAIPETGQHEPPVQVDHLCHVVGRFDPSDPGDLARRDEDVLERALVRQASAEQRGVVNAGSSGMSSPSAAPYPAG